MRDALKPDDNNLDNLSNNGEGNNGEHVKCISQSKLLMLLNGNLT